MQTVKGYFAALLAFLAMGLGMPAFADPPAAVDLTPLTNAVSFSTVSTGILAIAATLMTLYAAYAGVRFFTAYGKKCLIEGRGRNAPFYADA